MDDIIFETVKEKKIHGFESKMREINFKDFKTNTRFQIFRVF